jgi:hypothetical protein
MNIQEAIEKAGPGGKIRRKCWDDNIPLEIRGGYLYHDGEQFEICKTGLLTATDWEVVEPETIKVGDVVGWQGISGEAIVRAIGNKTACVQWSFDDILGLYPLDQLTLIRKGEKHVFEGVSIGGQNTQEIIVYGGSLEGAELYEGLYRMTLEPMED